MKTKICGAVALLSFIWTLGIIGSCDLGCETDFTAAILKAAAGLAVFAISLKIGGFTE